MSDPAIIVETRDALEHLRARGFGRLLRALEDPACYARIGCKAGQIDPKALGLKLGLSVERVRKMLSRARAALPD